MKPVLAIFSVLLSTLVLAAPLPAQSGSPDISVMGIELGNRASAESLLSEYGPTFGDDGRPNYYFYNKHATQVIRFASASWEDKYLITEIEVYAVGKSYRSPHFQLKKTGFFKTNNGLFIGYKQSVASLLSGFAIGVNDPGGKNQVRTGRVEKLFGEPDERTADGETITLVYKANGLKFTDLEDPLRYEAAYTFRKGKLKRIWLKMISEPEAP